MLLYLFHILRVSKEDTHTLKYHWIHTTTEKEKEGERKRKRERGVHSHKAMRRKKNAIIRRAEENDGNRTMAMKEMR